MFCSSINKFAAEYFFLSTSNLLDYFFFGFLFSFKHTPKANPSDNTTGLDNVGAITPQILESARLLYSLCDDCNGCTRTVSCFTVCISRWINVCACTATDTSSRKSIVISGVSHLFKRVWGPLEWWSDEGWVWVKEKSQGMDSQPTKGLTRGGDLRFAQVDVPSSV